MRHSHDGTPAARLQPVSSGRRVGTATGLGSRVTGSAASPLSMAPANHDLRFPISFGVTEPLAAGLPCISSGAARRTLHRLPRARSRSSRRGASPAHCYRRCGLPELPSCWSAPMTRSVHRRSIDVPLCAAVAVCSRRRASPRSPGSGSSSRPLSPRARSCKRPPRRPGRRDHGDRRRDRGHAGVPHAGYRRRRRRGAKVTIRHKEYRVVQATDSFAAIVVGDDPPNEQEKGQARRQTNRPRRWSS